MTEKDKLLRRLLARIRDHGYYHHIDMALVWCIGNASVKEICEKHLVSPDALYQQRSRLARQQEPILLETYADTTNADKTALRSSEKRTEAF